MCVNLSMCICLIVYQCVSRWVSRMNLAEVYCCVNEEKVKKRNKKNKNKIDKMSSSACVCQCVGINLNDLFCFCFIKSFPKFRIQIPW